MSRALAIVGCGYVGERALARAVAEGRRVVATSRDAAKATALARRGAVAHAIDPRDEALASLIAGADVLLHAIPPDPGGEVTPAILRAAVRASVPAIVYVGSTAVYAPDAGDVDEDTPVIPTPRGRPRLEAERLLVEAAARGDVAVGVLRVPAIYGPGRGLHVRLRQGGFRVPGDGRNHVSRIHVDDLVSIALALGDWLVERGRGTVRTYCVGDTAPTTLREHADGVAALLGLPPPPSVPVDEAPETLRGDRRVSGARVLRDLGLTLRYPTWREGVTAALAEERDS